MTKKKNSALRKAHERGIKVGSKVTYAKWRGPGEIDLRGDGTVLEVRINENGEEEFLVDFPSWKKQLAKIVGKEKAEERYKPRWHSHYELMLTDDLPPR